MCYSAKKTAEDKEKKKKKKLNRKAKQAEMEEAKEAEKKSWLTFMKSNKRASKNSTKKSIFASPDNFDGKVKCITQCTVHSAHYTVHSVVFCNTVHSAQCSVL